MQPRQWKLAHAMPWPHQLGGLPQRELHAARHRATHRAGHSLVILKLLLNLLLDLLSCLSLRAGWQGRRSACTSKALDVRPAAAAAAVAARAGGGAAKQASGPPTSAAAAMTDCLLWKYSARAGARAAVCCRGRAARTACGAGAGEGRCQRCRDPPISQTARKRSAPRRAGLRRGRAPGRCSFLLPVLSIYVGTGAGNVRVLGGRRWRRRMWQPSPTIQLCMAGGWVAPQARIPLADAIRGFGTRIWAACTAPALALSPSPHRAPSPPQP